MPRQARRLAPAAPWIHRLAPPAGWDQIYASNFDVSGMYVGACRQVCDVTVSHAWMEYNALGYSGTNSGGKLVIEDSRFDHNQGCFDTNTQIRSDPPPPQDGDCPGADKSAISHTRSCWVFMHNVVEDNNDAHAPIAPGGYASAGPVGTGMTISGGRHDTVTDNTFEGNGAADLENAQPRCGAITKTSNSGGALPSATGVVLDPLPTKLGTMPDPCRGVPANAWCKSGKPI